jgi:hypothetical protein
MTKHADFWGSDEPEIDRAGPHTEAIEELAAGGNPAKTGLPYLDTKTGRVIYR